MKNKGSTLQDAFHWVKPIVAFFASPFMPYKRTFVICLFLIAMALCAGPTAAGNMEGTNGNHTVVGGEYDYPPYNHSNAKGEPAGFNTELTQAIAGKMGLDVEIKLGSWAEIRKALKDGKIDVIQGMFYSEERAQAFDFSPPFATINHAVFGRKGSTAVRSTNELRDKEIIVMQGDIMHDYVVKKHLSGTLLLAPTPADVLRLLASGKGDYALVAELPGLYLIKDLKLSNLTIVGPAIEPSRYCYAVKKGDTILLSRFTEGLSILQQTGEYRELYDKWLGVFEPSQINIKLAVKYVAVALVSMAMLLAVTLLWSRMLRKKVKQKTKELQESGENIRHLIEDSPIAIVVTAGNDNKVQLINIKFAELFGYTIEDIPDMSHWWPLAYPEEKYRAEIMAEWFVRVEKVTVKTKGSIDPMESMVICKDGSQRYIEFHMSFIGARALTMFIDITERKRAEDALRKTTEVVEKIFAMTTTCIAYMDRDFNFIRVNKEYAEADGKTPENFIGKNHFDLFPNKENEVIFRRVVETGEQYIAHAKLFEYKEHPERGVSSWDWSLTPVKDSNGMVEALILSLVNVTERIKAQEELSKLNEELDNRVRERSAELVRKNAELEKMNKVFVGRELRMIELKERIKELENQTKGLKK